MSSKPKQQKRQTRWCAVGIRVWKAARKILLKANKQAKNSSPRIRPFLELCRWLCAVQSMPPPPDSTPCFPPFLHLPLSSSPGSGPAIPGWKPPAGIPAGATKDGPRGFGSLTRPVGTPRASQKRGAHLSRADCRRQVLPTGGLPL